MLTTKNGKAATKRKINHKERKDHKEEYYFIYFVISAFFAVNAQVSR